MAFTDALDLRTAVLEHVGSNAQVDIWPRLVSLAETRLNRELRHQEMIKSGTVTMASAVGDLPSDYLEMVDVRIGGTECTEVHITEFNQAYAPYYCYAIADGKLHLTVDDGSQAIQYYGALPTLADDLTATNWLLDLGPDVYLYSVFAEAVKTRPEVYAEAMMRRKAAMRGLKRGSNRAQHGNSMVRFAGGVP